MASILEPDSDNKPASPRKTISKRLRYEVLRRDDYACRYCGERAPGVVLTVDHIVPVALGGTDDPSNLGAACKDCNSGKTSSSPDAGTVARVSEDALRWSAAIERATQDAMEDLARNQERLDRWHTEWRTYDPVDWRGIVQPSPLPPNWQTLVLAFLTGGLHTFEVLESARIAQTAPNVRERFWYFHGIATNKLRDRHDAARRLLTEGDV